MIMRNLDVHSSTRLPMRALTCACGDIAAVLTAAAAMPARCDPGRDAAAADTGSDAVRRTLSSS